VERSESLAAEWYARAVDLNSPEAMNALAIFLEGYVRGGAAVLRCSHGVWRWGCVCPAVKGVWPKTANGRSVITSGRPSSGLIAANTTSVSATSKGRLFSPFRTSPDLLSHSFS
jgi:hypothetical protein